jgi:hypothetical protein
MKQNNPKKKKLIDQEIKSTKNVEKQINSSDKLKYSKNENSTIAAQMLGRGVRLKK